MYLKNSVIHAKIQHFSHSNFCIITANIIYCIKQVSKLPNIHRLVLGFSYKMPIKNHIKLLHTRMKVSRCANYKFSDPLFLESILSSWCYITVLKRIV